MKTLSVTEKWEHRLPDRSEVLFEPLQIVPFWRRFNPFSKSFFKKLEPSFYFHTSKLNKIFFWVRPSDISTPNDFRLVIDYIQLPNLPIDTITDGTVNIIKFDEKYSNLVAQKPVKFHFPSTGLVVIHYRIIDKDGLKPLDKDRKEIFVAQRTLSGTVGRGYNTEHYCNQGQMPIIILDYHSTILIKLTWGLIYLTGILTILTALFLLKK